MNIDVLAFTENSLAIFSALFMAVGFCFALFNFGRGKTYICGHNSKLCITESVGVANN